MLPDWPADDTDGFDGDKDEAKELIDEQSAKLFDLQQLLYADNTRKVLVVLQGMDTSGKDGTIKHVFKMVNPLGVKVANFKRPNDVELEHDYLWRVHHNTPRNGDITIFNRSHYEDVLVVRVHDLVPKKVWKQRYDHIRNFEQMLADEGTVIRKFFLHISKDEAARAPAGATRQPGQELEVRARRPRGAQVLGRLHRRLRGGALAGRRPSDAPWYVDPVGPQVVSQPAGRRRSSSRPSKALDLSYPEPAQGLDKIVIDD